ncbi:MAG: hypothetical protein JWO11_3997, partial [Nocardioides sp.]|nr:hypothetical protein [Nocardioides sp.]
FPGAGQPLSHYKDAASYEWRVNIVDHQDELLAAMQEVSPDLEAKDFADVLDTCDAIDRGIEGGELTQQTATRFDVDFGQAGELVLVSQEYACP